MLVGQEGTFRAEPVPSEASLPIHYSWDNGTYGATAVYSWTVTGTHAVELTGLNLCGVGQTIHTVRVIESWPYHFHLPLLERVY